MLLRRGGRPAAQPLCGSDHRGDQEKWQDQRQQISREAWCLVFQAEGGGGSRVSGYSSSSARICSTIPLLAATTCATTVSKSSCSPRSGSGISKCPLSPAAGSNVLAI